MEPIKKLFEKEIFSDLRGKKKELDLYQNILEGAISKNLLHTFKVTKFIEGTLHISTSSNAVAHKLKLMTKDIIRNANKNLDEANKILRVKLNVTVINSKVEMVNREVPKEVLKKISKLSEKLSTSPLKRILNKIIKKTRD